MTQRLGKKAICGWKLSQIFTPYPGGEYRIRRIVSDDKIWQKFRIGISLKQTETKNWMSIVFSSEFWASYGEAAKTAAGFFWKSGWAFVLGYFISAMIQAFIPKGRPTPYLGYADVKSVGLATVFGSISSSCSFAALATVLNASGVLFVGIMGFIYSDLMVPPW